MSHVSWIDEAFALPRSALTGLLAQLAAQSGPAADEASAVTHFRLGDKEEAVRCFAALPHDHRLDARSKPLLMRLRLAAGRSEEALRLAKEVIAADPRDQESLRTAGRICNMARDPDRADRFWRQLVEVDSSDPEAALQVARIAARRGVWESVALYAELATRAAPQVAETWRLRLDAAVRSGAALAIAQIGLPKLYALAPDLSRHYLDAALSGASPAEASILIAASQDAAPDNDGVAAIAAAHAVRWLGEGQAAQVAMQDDEAAERYAAVIAVAPRSAAAAEGLRQLMREHLLALRSAARDRDDLRVAEIATWILRFDPGCAEALLSRGRVALAGGRAQAALDDFTACCELEPANTWFIINQARALARLDRLVEAREAYQRVLDGAAAEPHRREAEEQLDVLARAMMRGASAALTEGRHHDAAVMLRACQALPAFEERATTMFRAATQQMLIQLKQLYAEGDPGLPVQARAFLALRPDAVLAWQILARTLMNARQHVEALTAWQRLAELEPAVAHYQLQIARCCQWLRQPGPGAVAAAEAIRLDPTLDEAHRLLAEASRT